MPCSKCAADLPEGSQYCLNCGEPVRDNKSAAVATAVLPHACANCGATLPEDAQFCLKCGRPASTDDGTPIVVCKRVELPIPRRSRSRAQRQRRIVVGVLVALAIGFVIWAVTSESPAAQQVQEFVGWKHDQSILDDTFSVSPQNFQYFKFFLPQGSVNVAVVGDFKVSPGARRDKLKDTDQNVEVYVLTDAAFTTWQNGFSTGSLYESGRVSEGKIRAELPAGAGVYYLVFNNKFAPKTAKTVQASALLRYKSWLPESLRLMKDRFWNWIGV